VYSNISGGGSVGIAIFGGGYGYTHEYPFDPDEPGWRHSAFDTQVIPNCPSTEKTWTSKFLIFYFNDDGSRFAGIDVDLHLIIGGHIKIGVEW